MRPASSFLEIARSLALQAAARIMELRGSPLVRERKADHSLVTNADHEADRIIRQGLRNAFPDHAILTEESGLDGPLGAEYLWVVDPLDGTTAYAKGIPGFSVMVGLLKEGKPFAGVVVDPLEGHVYEAMRGQGASAGKGEELKPVRVSDRSEWAIMPVVTSTGFPETLKAPIRKQLSGPWLPAVNSVGIKVGWLVRQIADIYINHHTVHYWDTCAPQIILEEAGGVITFLDGTPIEYPLEHGAYRHEGPTLASNGIRHQDVLRFLQSIKPPLIPSL